MNGVLPNLPRGFPTAVAALAAVLPALSLPAPAPAEVLATVDGEPAVTTDDVAAYFAKIRRAPGAPPVSPAAVADMVETLVMGRVLVLEAEAAGYADDPAFQQECEEIWYDMLEEHYWAALEEEAPVTEEEVRAFYETDRHWRKYSLLETRTRTEAEAAYAELEAGRPWEEVVRKYHLREEEKETAGAQFMPLFYDGREAARVAYATPAGNYTPPVPANDGVRWRVYRIDKVVHGRVDSYEEARPGLERFLRRLGAEARWKEIAAQLRRTVPIARREDMLEDLRTLPFSAFREKWGRREVAVGDVAGVPVSGFDFVLRLADFFDLSGDDLTEYRDADADDFGYVADKILALGEEEALRIAEARSRGMDRDPSLLRKYELVRAELLTDPFVTREFVAELPPITRADCEAYYRAHLDEFQVPEEVEVYLIVFPDRARAEAFHAEATAGASAVDLGEAHNRARGRELMDSYEPPPEIPPEEAEWLGVVRVPREAPAAAADEPFAAELRPRLFPYRDPPELSPVFRLADGRWAFYEPTYYQPFHQETLEEEGVLLKCQRKAWAAFAAGEEVERRSREWLAWLRARHDVAVAAEKFEAVAARLNAAP